MDPPGRNLLGGDLLDVVDEKVPQIDGYPMPSLEECARNSAEIINEDRSWQQKKDRRNPDGLT